MAAGIHNDVKFFFINGIMNEDKHGHATTEVIRGIIQKASDSEIDKDIVEFQFNNSAPTEKIATEIGLAVCGAFATGYAIEREVEKKADAISRTAGLLGLAAIIVAGYDYSEMQKQKNEVANTFKGRVIEFLKSNTSNVVNLVFHSQGADVGYRALESLEGYRNRIRVVTLGAMTTIPSSMASRVTNYKFANDWISKIGGFPFEKIRQSTDEQGDRPVVYLNSQGIVNHSVHEYLKEGIVQQELLSLLENK